MLSPMCMYSSKDGFATDFHLTHLGSRALGGFGLLMQEATAVSPEGRITYRDLGIWKDEHKAKLKEIVDFVHSHNTKIGVQLAHAGRKASVRPPYEGRGQLTPVHPNGWQTVSSSEIPFWKGDVPPLALNKEGIKKVKSDFVSAAVRAKETGYDVVEIHAAHGYLLHQFYSPFSNQRTDEYGGSFENRIRLLLEVIEEVKAVWGEEKPVFVRISATDWKEGGWTIEDSVKLAHRLKELEVDLIDVSSTGNIPSRGLGIPFGPGYQVPFAEKIRKETGILTGAVGEITTPDQAEEILQNLQADLIVIGREALRNPYFPRDAARYFNLKSDWPKQYDWAVG